MFSLRYLMQQTDELILRETERRHKHTWCNSKWFLLWAARHHICVSFSLSAAWSSCCDDRSLACIHFYLIWKSANSLKPLYESPAFLRYSIMAFRLLIFLKQIFVCFISHIEKCLRAVMSILFDVCKTYRLEEGGTGGCWDAVVKWSRLKGRAQQTEIKQTNK